VVAGWAVPGRVPGRCTELHGGRCVEPVEVGMEVENGLWRVVAAGNGTCS
jgi:hypothetical protein